MKADVLIRMAVVSDNKVKHHHDSHLFFLSTMKKNDLSRSSQRGREANAEDEETYTSNDNEKCGCLCADVYGFEQTQKTP